MTSGTANKIYLVLNSVPPGRVITYGQLADLCGVPNGARATARALKSLPEDTRIAWHRVVNAQGKISLPEPGAKVQRERLEQEGVQFVSGRIDLKHYRWRP